MRITARAARNSFRQTEALRWLFVVGSVVAACTTGESGENDAGRPSDAMADMGPSHTIDAAMLDAGGADTAIDTTAPIDVARMDGSSGGRDGSTVEGEVCSNGVDDNDNGRVDEGCACLPGETQRCYTGRPANAGVGACAWGMQRCVGTGEFGAFTECEGATLPGPEYCDSIDNDCDGTVDNGCECRPMDTRGCYTGPAATRGIGACREGTQTCMSGAGGVGSTWGRCAGEVLPASEVCDGIDNDCDGTVDNSSACAPVCGDGRCNGSETCTTCPADCGACPARCGDGRCDPGEDCCDDCFPCRCMYNIVDCSSSARCNSTLNDYRNRCVSAGCSWSGPSSCTVGGSPSNPSCYGAVGRCS